MKQNEDVMTIILGIDDGPGMPGMHGPMDMPCPTPDAVAFVTKLRDMCEEFLRSTGKDEPSPREDDDSTGDDGKDFWEGQ